MVRATPYKASITPYCTHHSIVLVQEAGEPVKVTLHIPSDIDRASGCCAESRKKAPYEEASWWDCFRQVPNLPNGSLELLGGNVGLSRCVGQTLVDVV